MMKTDDTGERQIRIHARWLRSRLTGHARRIADLMPDDLLVAKEREHADLYKAAVIAKALREDRERQEAARALIMAQADALAATPRKETKSSKKGGFWR
jgi:hypothetical protein